MKTTYRIAFRQWDFLWGAVLVCRTLPDSGKGWGKSGVHSSLGTTGFTVLQDLLHSQYNILWKSEMRWSLWWLYYLWDIADENLGG